MWFNVAMTTPPPPDPARPDEPRKPRADGAQSRERLLLAAMRLFAAQGFANTSTREIALAAGANVAAISYYFGDKAGLYRAAFTDKQPDPRQDIVHINRPELSLREALEVFYRSLLAPLKQDDVSRLCLRLWMREMLEPTGLWAEEIDTGIKPGHAALVEVLCRHLGLKEADDDIHRLAFGVVGLGLQLTITRDVIDSIRPQLLGSEPALEQWILRLVDYAEAMVAAEGARVVTKKTTKKPRTA